MKYRYAEMTWPESNDAVKQGRVAVLPVVLVNHFPCC